MIKANIHKLNNHILEIATNCKRNSSDIRVIAVSKRFPIDFIHKAHSAGQRLFGENYIKEAADKFEHLPVDAKLHCIGHIQSNKAKQAASIFSMIETIDSLKLAILLDKNLKNLNKTMDILIQVNIGKDKNKSGVKPEEAEELLSSLKPLTTLRPLGLMTIPPLAAEPEETRPYFRGMYELSRMLQTRKLFFDNSKIELSMGMTNDYHVAIEEGATLIRVGTAIFGQRPLIRK